jgi:hypothetical protein
VGLRGASLHQFRDWIRLTCFSVALRGAGMRIIIEGHLTGRIGGRILGNTW